jgi:chorismate dehydratase
MTDRVIRVASVSYLNAKPLIWGLEHNPRVNLDLAIPSRLIDGLRDRTSDVALLPTIDYQRLNDLAVVPAGGIGSESTTLTVRIFAKQPIEKIHSLACDTDSHTSVALARIILAERHGMSPEFVDLSRANDRADQARLLIGDKVVCEEPPGYSHQYDLGYEWNQLTGLPFVFAVWTARAGAELGELPHWLTAARQEGLRHVEEIIERFATPRGWPAPLARQYLTVNLQYEIGPRQLQAIEKFHALAEKHGIIQRRQDLRVLPL